MPGFSLVQDLSLIRRRSQEECDDDQKRGSNKMPSQDHHSPHFFLWERRRWTLVDNGTEASKFIRFLWVPFYLFFYSGALPDVSYAHFWWIKFITIFPWISWNGKCLLKTFGLKKKGIFLKIDVFGPQIKCRFSSRVLPGINSFSFFFISRQVRFETLKVDYIHWHREKKKKR